MARLSRPSGARYPGRLLKRANLVAEQTGIAGNSMAVTCWRFTAGAFLGFFAAALFAGPADARPLKKATCKALAAERAELARQGVEKAILKGPEWTQANMAPQTLELVRRYLTVEEMLRFRCSGIKLPELAPEQIAAPPVKQPGKTLQASTTQAATPRSAKKNRIKPPPAPKKKPPVAAIKPVKQPAAAAKKSITAAPPATGATVPLPDRRPPFSTRNRTPVKKRSKKTKKVILDLRFNPESN